MIERNNDQGKCQRVICVINVKCNIMNNACAFACVCVNVNVNARATLISVKAVPLLHPFRIMFFYYRAPPCSRTLLIFHIKSEHMWKCTVALESPTYSTAYTCVRHSTVYFCASGVSTVCLFFVIISCRIYSKEHD